MSDTKTERDYSSTLFLPKTDFPMRAGLPTKEPEILAKWEKMDLYKTLREQSKGRPKYVLHDGPPYANGNIHIGHALNKILKDLITRSFQMRGYDSNYVPGWDCHGLPIEWKIEEQYRARGKDKDEVPVNEFREECRQFAKHWIGVQTEEFKRLGVVGDFVTPYLTMNFEAEAIIANELMKFAMSGQLYRGSKPVMWSVVERTALAEAEVEYETYESDTVWVKFPIVDGAGDLAGASVVIWTTTPWTMPGNRCVCYSTRIPYGLYKVTEAANDFGPQPGEKVLFADVLAQSCADKAKVRIERVADVPAHEFEGMILDHPLKGMGVAGYQFKVPMLQGDHVTDEAGTGFVHTAPGHGRDDFENWVEKRAEVEALGIDSSIPFTVGPDGRFTVDAPGFEGEQVITDKGEKGKANDVVIKALIGTNNLFARGRLKHEYPHSWRSKKPIIFRNTPQWFVHMDKSIPGMNGTLRSVALKAIDDTRFVPARGQTRLRGMIEDRPDWVLSRQRAWGVPIAVFVNEVGEVLKDEAVNQRIFDAFKVEGADAWYADGAAERFLGSDYSTSEWTQVRDILDVWFDSGSTHAFCLEQRDDLKWPADLYLEGSDQHRGWFHSSLLESCGTRGRAPYDAVLTHGFTMDEQGRKMSKSLGNTTVPQDVIKQYGADILRLWVASVDYAEDQRIGPEILKSNVDAYRKLRNTLRWMLGSLAHFQPEDAVADADMPELEKLMLSHLARLDEVVRKGYDEFDFRRIYSALGNFMNIELSSFYFDVRKDALYCDAPSSLRRRASLTVIDRIFNCVVTWMAPILSFTCDEAWMERHGPEACVHTEQFPDVPAGWRNKALEDKWTRVMKVRSVVTGALEVERREKRIGSSLESAPEIFIEDEALLAAVAEVDMAETCITSGASITGGAGPADAWRMDEVRGVSVVPARARGTKCARSWKVSTEVGSDAEFPDVTPRDADALREWAVRGVAV